MQNNVEEGKIVQSSAARGRTVQGNVDRGRVKNSTGQCGQGQSEGEH